MPNINEAFPSKYLKASDLKGQQPVVTIDRVDFEPVGQSREMKAVIYFQNKDKGVVLNKTNANKITEITGSALTEEWRGQQIRLYPSVTTFQGEEVECIRVKPVTANGQRMRMTAQPPPPPEPEHHINHSAALTDDDIPF
jgi:hypothetical protein